MNPKITSSPPNIPIKDGTEFLAPGILRYPCHLLLAPLFPNLMEAPQKYQYPFSIRARELSRGRQCVPVGSATEVSTCVPLSSNGRRVLDLSGVRDDHIEQQPKWDANSMVCC